MVLLDCGEGLSQTFCDFCPCLQPGDGAVAVDELQDNKKLKVGAMWSLPSEDMGELQTQGTVALMLGTLGWAQVWEAPGSASRVSQGRSGLFFFFFCQRDWHHEEALEEVLV